MRYKNHCVMLIVLLFSICASAYGVEFRLVGPDVIMAGDTINVRLDIANFESVSDLLYVGGEYSNFVFSNPVDADCKEERGMKSNIPKYYPRF